MSRAKLAQTNLAALDTQAQFRHELNQALMQSERKRMLGMSVFFAACGLAYLAYVLIPDVLTPTARAAFIRQAPVVAALYCVGIAYELVARTTITRLLRQGKSPPTALRYSGAVIEVSVVSVGIYYAGMVFDPVAALFATPSVLYFVIISLSTLRLDKGLCLFTGTLAAGEYLLVAFWTLHHYPPAGETPSVPPILTEPAHHVARAGILFLAGAAAAFMSNQIRLRFESSVRSLIERDRAVSLFGQHVSPQVAEKLLAQTVDVGPEVREVCVMFLDIRDFTKFADGRNPDQVIAFLNDLFAPMVDIVNRHGGIINKFLGDGFLAIFGAPLDDGEASRHAVAAATDIIRHIEARNAAQPASPTRVGMGLHTGRAVTGNVGSAHRKEYTVIGDVVNLASRVEQLNKQFGSQILVTAAVYAAIAKDASINSKPLGAVPVKGQASAVEVFQLA